MFREKQVMEKRCAVCAHFTAYFTKAYCCFLRTDCGHCRVLNETVQKCSICEKWRFRYSQPKRKKGIILEELGKAVTTINAVKLILDEEDRPD